MGARRPRATGWVDSTAVYRWTGEQLTDLGLPPGHDRPWYTAVLASGGADRLYLAGGGYRTSYWDGSAWSAVREPGSTADLPLHRLAAHPGGGVVWGLDEAATPRRLFRLRGGVAERVAFPLESRTDESVRAIAVDRDGNPYLAFSGGVLALDSRGWRTLPIPGEWTASFGAVWPEDDGSVWVAATRPLGRTPPGYADHQLAFLRIRPRAASSTSTGIAR